VLCCDEHRLRLGCLIVKRMRISDINNEWNKGCHPRTSVVKGGGANWLDRFHKTCLDINITLVIY
jgi:hypothetical protein